MSFWIMSGPTEYMYICTCLCTYIHMYMSMYVCPPDFAMYYYQTVTSLTAMSVMTVNPSQAK